MNSWAPLWSGLVDSSVWEEEDHVFRVFMAMMSLKDANHIVSMDGFRLAKRIHMPIEKVLAALEVLAAPDTKRPGQEFDGRRIEPVDDGWLVLKGEYYRKLVREEMRRARNRRSQSAYRERKKQAAGNGSGAPLAGEREYVKALERGDTAGAERILEAGLPATAEQPASAVPAQGMPSTSGSQGPDGTGPTEPGLPPAAGIPGLVVESGRFINGEWVPEE